MMTSGPNLLRDDDGGGGVTAVVIMGASGNLTRTKLAPALFSLYRKGRLPADVRVIGLARDAIDDDQFRKRLRESIEDAGDEEWEEFASRLSYVSADVTDTGALKRVYDRRSPSPRRSRATR